MTEIVYTPEQVAKSVSAAYDSVNLINELTANGSLTEDETNILNRNIAHIHIMLAKDWFIEGLTNEQLIELQEI
jgi:hypothetical protein